jgi:prevent-host-death family protein
MNMGANSSDSGTIDGAAENTDIMDNTKNLPSRWLMAQTTAMEFQRRFGEFQHQAQREPVEITRHGRRELVLMSADHYDWLVAAARRTHRTTESAPVIADAVRRAEMDPEHSGLDDLLK